MAKQGEIIVGLDIGTTKVVAVVGEVNDDGGLDVLGYGQAPSRGLRKGVIVDIEATVQSIKQAVGDAEAMSGCTVENVYAGIAGAHIRAFNSHGIAHVKSSEVRSEDVSRVLALARAAAIPQDRQVLHILPQEYIIDGQEGIRSPVGICGVRLESKVHVVTASSTAVQNVVKCAELAGLKVNDVVLEPLASAEAVLTAEERDLGVCVVDIGGGTTDIAIFGNGALVHTAVIPLGGNHLTNDIVIGLRTPFADAERIKREFGCALGDRVSGEETIDVPSVGDRTSRRMSRRILTDVIGPRMEEILQLVAREISACGWEDQLTSGLVLTGGTSLIPGLEDMAEQLLGMLVRRGEPRAGGTAEIARDPRFSTAIGLMHYGLRADEQRFYMGRQPKRFVDRVSEWMSQMF